MTNRFVVVGAIVLVLGALLAADRIVARPDASPPSVFRNRLVATPTDSGSSTWFCAGGVATTTSAVADLRVVLANPTSEPARGTVTFMGERGQRTSVPIVVPAQGRSELTSKDVLPVSDVAALVELNVGGVAVDHRLTRGTQSVLAPCTPTASDTWHFPLGATTRDASTVISLFNPFAEDALLDFRFASDRGGARPTALQGFVVPAGSVRTVDVGSYVRRRSAVATTITARVGRVIADEVIRFDGSGGPRGVTLVPGSPAAGRSWYFPAGRSTSVLKERYAIYNPSGVDVQAHVDVVVDGGDIEPFVLDVPARDEVLLDLGDEPRVPKNVDYSVVVSTPARSGVVAGRLVDARSTFRRGLAGTLGSRIASDEWLVADASASALIDDRIVILNPTDTPASVGLRTLADTGPAVVHFLGGPSSDELTVPAGGRVEVRLGDVVALNAGAVVVTTDGAPVVVEHVRVAVARQGPLVLREPVAGAPAPALVAPTTVAPTTAAPTTVATTAVPTTLAPTTVAPPVAPVAPTTGVAAVSVAPATAGAPVTTVAPTTAAPATATALAGSGARFATGIAVVAATTAQPTSVPSTSSSPPSPSTTSQPVATAVTPTPAPTPTTTATPPTSVGVPPSTSPAAATTSSVGPPSTSTNPVSATTVLSTTSTPTSTSSTTTSTTTTSTTTTTTTVVPGTRIAVGRTLRAALGTSAAIAIPLR